MSPDVSAFEEMRHLGDDVSFFWGLQSSNPSWSVTTIRPVEFSQRSWTKRTALACDQFATATWARLNVQSSGT